MIKRSIVTVLSLVVILWLAGASAWAQGRSGGSHPGGTSGTGMPRGSSAGNSASSTSSSTRGSNSSSNSLPGEVLSHNNGKLNTTLSAKLQSQGLLTAGTDLKTACAGFRTLGQCIAAIHVGHNLSGTGTCSFDTLKTAMTATPPESLGKAIQGCAPHASAKAAARTATKQANTDIRDSESESGSSGKR